MSRLSPSATRTSTFTVQDGGTLYVAAFALLFAGWAVEVRRAGTLRAIADALSKPQRQKLRGLQFFPLCGEPMDYHIGSNSSTVLSGRFQSLLSSSKDPKHTLSNTPARIPREFQRSHNTVSRFIRWSKNYSRIFVGKESLANNMDAVLTSAGSFMSSTYDNLWVRDSVRCEQCTEDELKELTIGDIGGVFLPQPKMSTAASRRFKALTDRWTGVTFEHLSECAKRKSRLSKHGVLLFAAGTSKTSIVQRSLSMGLVNELVIDSELGTNLLGTAKP